MAICKLCLEFKEDNEFYKNRRECKSCTLRKAKQRRDSDLHKYRAISRDRLKNPINKARKQELDRIYRANNKDKAAAYHQANRARILERQKIYREKTHKQRMDYDKEYRKNRLNSDPLFKLKDRVRKAIRKAWTRKGWIKTSATQDIVGCDWSTLQAHLLQTWQQNYPDTPLVWTNVHIDHIIPLATATTEEQVMVLNHYTNLQLLTAEDNLRKSDLRVLQLS